MIKESVIEFNNPGFKEKFFFFPYYNIEILKVQLPKNIEFSP